MLKNQFSRDFNIEKCPKSVGEDSIGFHMSICHTREDIRGVQHSSGAGVPVAFHGVPGTNFLI